MCGLYIFVLHDVEVLPEEIQLSMCYPRLDQTLQNLKLSVDILDFEIFLKPVLSMLEQSLLLGLPEAVAIHHVWHQSLYVQLDRLPWREPLELNKPHLISYQRLHTLLRLRLGVFWARHKLVVLCFLYIDSLTDLLLSAEDLLGDVLVDTTIVESKHDGDCESPRDCHYTTNVRESGAHGLDAPFVEPDALSDLYAQRCKRV